MFLFQKDSDGILKHASRSSLQSRDSEISFDNSRVRSPDRITAVDIDVAETVCIGSITGAVFTGTSIKETSDGLEISGSPPCSQTSRRIFRCQ